MPIPELDIHKISEILLFENLTIPTYQRPYTWQSKNVLSLLQDIQVASKKQPGYRIGSLIFERDKENNLNIVDGQQRLVTIFIILYELREVIAGIFKADFSHKESQQNIKKNELTIRQWLKLLNEEEQGSFKKYLLGHCEAVTIVLDSLTEAFQFFDGQNSRGAALEPTDLLKAYHLREMDNVVEQAACVNAWESISKADIKSLFGTYLYRIRLWSRGKPAGYFSKEEIGEFKGFTLTTNHLYPYLAHYTTNDRALGPGEPYPFQITGVIINGTRFFEMTIHYHLLLKNLFDGVISKKLLDFHVHTNYDQDNRNGDRYTKILYKSAVLRYYDRFGDQGLEQYYPLLFMWAYKPRIENRAVRQLSINSYVRQKDNNLFQLIQDTYHHEELAVIRDGLKLTKITQDIYKVRQVFEKYGYDNGK